MNIAYKGGFLRLGLLDLGHNILDIQGEINSGIKELPGRIDPVILEPYGSFFPIWEPLEYETAIWGFDSPINEFWLKEAARLADHLFLISAKLWPRLPNMACNPPAPPLRPGRLFCQAPRKNL